MMRPKYFRAFFTDEVYKIEEILFESEPSDYLFVIDERGYIGEIYLHPCHKYWMTAADNSIYDNKEFEY